MRINKPELLKPVLIAEFADTYFVYYKLGFKTGYYNPQNKRDAYSVAKELKDDFIKMYNKCNEENKKKAVEFCSRPQETLLGAIVDEI